MADTKIEWAEKVWNPITGCSPISEGCDHCYAKRMANRLAGRYGYPADDPFRVTFHDDRLTEPFRVKKPHRIFVCSMADIFHDGVTERMLNAVWTTMSSANWHTFIVLTKRPDRALKSLSKWGMDGLTLRSGHGSVLPNVWIGVTAENQARADERIPILLRIPAAVRFVSVEPMLGPVGLQKAHGIYYDEHGCNLRKLDWVICGGETGPGARPVHPDWVRSLRDQCQASGVPFFFKQWGEWLPSECDPEYTTGPGLVRACPAGSGDPCCPGLWRRTGKKAAGRLLDGREWNEFPAKI